MSLDVLNNVSSVLARLNIHQSQGASNTTLQKLSSGLKINSGADGSAAHVIATNQDAHVNISQQGQQLSAAAKKGQALSGVQDTRIAAESSTNKQMQVLKQAGTSVLGNANQTSQELGKLLRV